MEQLKFIVSKLNEDPFQQNIRLVDFDEKSPTELLQTLHDVFETIDADMKADVRHEDESTRAIRITNFLIMLNYEGIPHDDESKRRQWIEALGRGDKSIVCEVMNWALSVHDRLKRRAYLARFLVPIEIPVDLQEDSVLVELLDEYRELQMEFRETHKQYDAKKAIEDKRGGSKLKAEIRQLKNERSQLKERISKLNTRTENDQAFSGLLRIVSKMRQAQEEEIRVGKRLKDQQMFLKQANGKHEEAQRRLRMLQEKTSAKDESLGSIVMTQLGEDVKELTRVQSELAAERSRLQQRMNRIEESKNEPKRTPEAVDHLRAVLGDLQEEYDNAREEVDSILTNKHQVDAKILIYRQQYNLSRSKLMEKEHELESKRSEMEHLRSDVQELESRVKESDVAPAPGGWTSICGGNNPEQAVKVGGEQFHQKIELYKKAKTELTELRAEGIVLQRTEQVLKSRASNLDDFLRKQEEAAGVAGFRNQQSRLEAASEQAKDVNDIKGQTLEDISVLVKRIATKLDEKKAVLKPLIKELQEKKQSVSELEERYLKKKSRYDKYAVAFTGEVKELEDQCDFLQEERINAERQYHLLAAQGDIIKGGLEKVELEDRCEQGKERFLKDFRTMQDYYQNTLEQQEILARQLRKQQRDIHENEAFYSSQKSMFTNLETLLALKLKTKVSSLDSQEDESPGKLSDEILDFGRAQVLQIH